MSSKRVLTIVTLLVLLVSVLPAALTAAPPEPATEPLNSAGAEPAKPAIPEDSGVESLSGSFVAFDPSVGGDMCFIPGATQTFCFEAHSYTTDWEYVYHLWTMFPTDWTVLDVYVQGTPVCASGGTWGAFSWSFQTAPYEVNIAGAVRLHVDGLAFQQQDRGAAVCASISLWCALQKVSHVAGHRTPTPYAITAAAKSPFPAVNGLTCDGMATALSNLGYIADTFAPEENRPWFRAKMVACIESQLPIVLLLSREVETGAGTRTIGHAVTVTGFSEPDTPIEVPAPIKEVEPIPLKGASVEVVYVHDDNLGSHAHYELSDSSETDSEGRPKLALYRGRTGQADFLLDVSEVDRDRDMPSVLAVVADGVPPMSQAAIDLTAICKHLSTPFIFPAS